MAGTKSVVVVGVVVANVVGVLPFPVLLFVHLCVSLLCSSITEHGLRRLITLPHLQYLDISDTGLFSLASFSCHNSLPQDIPAIGRHPRACDCRDR